ncbi:UNKNOWN [Stylonychia lemnae]|uniref:Uncharacterized protein n=1 Tax=Stylonychia lemnae TaxID=5949 RepID=A0A078A532_STYLE|nr:UNKNOWN [Stylonychia lemnae]|eukprot:CDW75839.1 UNKNOWN [Stylonychia lemnae]
MQIFSSESSEFSNSNDYNSTYQDLEQFTEIIQPSILTENQLQLENSRNDQEIANPEEIYFINEEPTQEQSLGVDLNFDETPTEIIMQDQEELKEEDESY